MAGCTESLQVAWGPGLAALLECCDVVDVGCDLAARAERPVEEDVASEDLPALAAIEGVAGASGSLLVVAGVFGAAATVGGRVRAVPVGAEAGGHHGMTSNAQRELPAVPGTFFGVPASWSYAERTSTSAAPG